MVDIILVVILIAIIAFSYYKLVHGTSVNRSIVKQTISRTKNDDIRWTIITNPSDEEEYFGIDEEKNMHLHITVGGGISLVFPRSLFVHFYKRNHLPIYGDCLGHISITPAFLLRDLEQNIVSQTRRSVKLHDITESRRLENLKDLMDESSNESQPVH